MGYILRHPEIFIVKCSLEVFFSCLKNPIQASVFSEVAILSPNSIIPMQPFNLHLKPHCLCTLLFRNNFFLEEHITNLILSHVLETYPVYFFLYDF